ncbi:MAG TPA: hypothetical protein VFN92_06585, partial [Solirubrobacterales bacterium]|nr:hypothetical protein [Solirubrobacterales bacterium]
ADDLPFRSQRLQALADDPRRLAADEAMATVERLEGEGVVGEIRRMLGAESSDEAATEHARELLKAA